MRLGHLRLERYGPFEDLDLALDPAPGRVNLIVAPNGFGKSVIRRAIGDFLFGIEARSPMTFRYGTEKMFLRADVSRDGETLSLVRRKGNGNTLAVAGGAEVSPEDTRRLLGGADETLFREMFGLDTALLRSGGEELIKSQGRLGRVLFAAGGGMGRVRELLTELERKRDELGKATARHKSRPIWAALSGFEQASHDLRHAALKPDGWSALEKAAEDAKQHLETLLAAQLADAQERDRLRGIGACRPWLDRLQIARLVLADVGDAQELDDGFEKRWRDALAASVQTAGAATAARAELTAALEARAGLSFDAAWVAAELDIKALGDLRGKVLGAEEDLPGVERALDADISRADALRRELAWDAAVTLPLASVVRDAQKRLLQHPKLAADAAMARDRKTDAERALAMTRSEMDALPVQGDVTAMADIVALLRAGGDPAARLDASRRKLREAEAALRRALSEIPDSPFPETALTETAAPSEAVLAAVGKNLDDAENACRLALREQLKRQSEIGTEQTKLAALEKKAMLPPQGALEAARSHREALWAAIRHAGRPPDGAVDAVQRYAASPGVGATQAASGLPAEQTIRLDADTAVHLDRAIRQADSIADALITHGQEVAQAAALRARLADLQAALAREDGAVVAATGTLEQAKQALAAIARSAGGTAADIAALRVFLKSREVAVACRNVRDAANAELADTEHMLTGLGHRLAASMQATMVGADALPILLAEANRRIAAEQKLAARRDALAAQARTQTGAASDASTACDKAQRILTDWEVAWRGVVAALSRPEGETPALTAAALERIEDLRRCEQTIAGYRDRVHDMRGAIDSLSSRIARLADLSAEYAARHPADAAEAFRLRLETELRDAARCADADRRVAAADVKLTSAVATAEDAARSLTGLRAALRAETNDEAELQLARCRAVSAARADSAEASRQLAVQGGGLSIEMLAARAVETTAEADAARISAIEAATAERVAEIEAAREQRSVAAAALDRASNGLDAADAAHRRQAAQALLSRTAEEALVLHATHALLQTALDRQSARADQPLLTRIGEVFRQITAGFQSGVKIEDAKDGPIMVALEADGMTRKSLDQLSEGTCDQLYLALRIAALEDYAKAASPLPFIADDVLQTFDDPRTTATLEALLGLSRTVQVIALTHHTHVGDLAAALPGGGMNVLRLG